MLLLLLLAGAAAALWEPCDIVGDSSGLYEAECLAETVPLFYDAPDDSRNVTFFTQRVWAAGDGAQDGPDVWFLYGGPGSALTEGVAAQYLPLLALVPGSTWYFPDYRGVGQSSNLGWDDCFLPDLSGYDSSACMASAVERFGDALQGYSTTNIARDILGVLSNTSSTGTETKETFVIGISWGTYVANRLLQLGAGELLSGVVLDGVCAPGQCMALHLGVNQDWAFRALVDYCALDAECASQLGGDPWAFVADLYAAVDAGSNACAAALGVDRTALRDAVWDLVATPGLRNFAMATLVRMERCDADDQAALGVLFGSRSKASPLPPGDSPVQMFQIEYSELWWSPFGFEPPSEAELQAEYDGYFAADSLLSAYVFRPGYDNDTQRYGNDDGFFALVADADADLPVLVLNGDLDGAAPDFQAALVWRALDGPLTQIVVVPYAAHTTISQSPVDGSDLPCGASIASSWIVSGEADVSCLQQLQGLDFDGTSDVTLGWAELLYGTDSLWGASSPSSGGGSSSSSSSSDLGWPVAFAAALVALVMTNLYWMRQRRVLQEERMERDGYASLN